MREISLFQGKEKRKEFVKKLANREKGKGISMTISFTSFTVSYEASRSKWRAQFRANSRVIFVGRFDTEAEALQALAFAKVETGVETDPDPAWPESIYTDLAAVTEKVNALYEGDPPPKYASERKAVTVRTVNRLEREIADLRSELHDLRVLLYSHLNDH